MKLKAVIIEDELPLLRELVETFSWRSVNCEVCGTASSVEEARRVISETRPDIIITDIKLPDGDGLSLLEEMPHRAAIIITGYSQIEFAQKALRVGAADFILKPLDDEELRQAVQRAVIKASEGHPLHGVAGKTSNALVHDALLFIQKQFHKDVSLLEAAEHLEITEGHLASIFKKETGKTFVQVLTEHRMTVAATLLKDPRKRISDVAEACGYNDSTYFSKVFRRTVGMSPRRYREQE